VPVLPVRGATGTASGKVDSSLTVALLAMESRMAGMEQQLKQLDTDLALQQISSRPRESSQAQMDMVTEKLAYAFSRVTQRMEEQVASMARPSMHQSREDSYSYREDKEKVDPVEMRLKELSEAVERLSHQTDDRFSSLVKSWDGRSSQGAEGIEKPHPGHACRSPPCSRDEESCHVNGNCCADLMYEMLLDFTSFLRRHNVTYMVTEGTLLGAIRDKDIIPYTADLDLFIPREGWEKVALINEEQTGSKSYYFMQDPDEIHCARVCAVWKGLPANRAPFDKHFEWNTEKLGTDLPYYMDIYDEDMDFAQSFEHLVFPTSTVTIRNRTFPAPREKEIYIEARYGPSWRTPDHQAREIAEKYPTHQQGKEWSKQMLMLRSAQKDVQLGYRLLERATVDIQTGHLLVKTGATQRSPRAPAKNLSFVGLRISQKFNASVVSNGSLRIAPPDEFENEIVSYVVYFGKEDSSLWADLDSIVRIDAGFDYPGGEQTPPKEDKWGNKLIRPIGSIQRCGNSGDPFKECSRRGMLTEVPIPAGMIIPQDGTHLLVAAENEAGESNQVTAISLNPDDGEEPMRAFSLKVKRGLTTGLAMSADVSVKCLGGKPFLDKKSFEDLVGKMLLKTQQSMKEAMEMLADWVNPLPESLKACEGDLKQTIDKIASAQKSLKNGKVLYEPGKALKINDQSIFVHVNSMIASFRKERWATFGKEVGELLEDLATDASPQQAAVVKEEDEEEVTSFKPSTAGLRGLTQRAAALPKSAEASSEADESQVVQDAILEDVDE